MTWAAPLETKTQGSTGTAASQSCTLATSPVAGDFLVVLYDSYTGSGAAVASASIADNKGGNTWTQDIWFDENAFGSVRSIAIWSTTVVNGGSSFQVTITPNISTKGDVTIHRYGSPGGAVSRESAHANRAATGTTLTTGSVSIATGPDLVVAIGGSDFDLSTFTLTQRIHNAGGAGLFYGTEDSLNATSSVNPGFTLVSNGNWICAAAAYSYAAGGIMHFFSGETEEHLDVLTF
jgi:hypothetical protein